MSEPKNIESETQAAVAGAARGSAPWFVLFYMFAFFLLFEMDWKLGTAWLLWRLGHSERESWEKKAQNEKS